MHMVEQAWNYIIGNYAGDVTTNYCYIFTMFCCYKQLQRYQSKEVRLQNIGTAKFTTFRPFSSALALLGHHSPGASGNKCAFEV